jgi:hypothetical protein
MSHRGGLSVRHVRAGHGGRDSVRDVGLPDVAVDELDGGERDATRLLNDGYQLQVFEPPSVNVAPATGTNCQSYLLGCRVSFSTPNVLALRISLVGSGVEKP